MKDLKFEMPLVGINSNSTTLVIYPIGSHPQQTHAYIAPTCVLLQAMLALFIQEIAILNYNNLHNFAHLNNMKNCTDRTMDLPIFIILASMMAKKKAILHWQNKERNKEEY